MRTDCGVEGAGCVINERIITQERVAVSEVAAFLASRPRLRRKRKAGEVSATRTKPRRHRGRFIDAQMSNWPVTPRADLNLGSVRFFVVVVGRIVVFIVVFLFGFFSLFCLSQRYCPKSDLRLRGKLALLAKTVKPLKR